MVRAVNGLVMGDENRQQICKSLIPVLQQTQYMCDLVDLDLDEQTELVTATFSDGYQKKANVTADSGIAMIVDIIRQIM